MRLLKKSYPSIELEDGDMLSIFDTEGNVILRVDIGVKSQRPERCVTLYMPEGKTVKTLWLTSCRSVMIVPKKEE